MNKHNREKWEIEEIKIDEAKEYDVKVERNAIFYCTRFVISTFLALCTPTSSLFEL